MRVIIAKSVILQFLLDGPKCCNRIAETAKSMHRLSFKNDSIYDAFDELESEGYIDESYLDPSPEESGSRYRKNYVLTSKGMKTALKQRGMIAAVFGLVEPSEA